MEFLKDVLGDELYQQVSEKLTGNDKIRIANVADGSFIPKDKFDSERDTAKQLKAQISELNTQLAALKESAANNDSLQQKIAQMQSDMAAKDTAMQKQMLEYRIKDSIRGSKAKNADIVLRMVDQNKVSIDGENLIGLSEQLEALKKSDAYLFEDAPNANGGIDPHQNPSGGGAANNNWSVNQAIRAAAGRN